MATHRIKKDDVVYVRSGRGAGSTGKVIAVDYKTERAIVEGVKLVKKNIRKNEKLPNGQIMEVPAPIHLSNLMPYDPKAKKGVRVSFVREDGKSIRVAKGTGHRFE